MVSNRERRVQDLGSERSLVQWSAMAGRIAVVDTQNQFVRWEERAEIHRQRLIHRSVHVLVFDSQERLIVQRRHRRKDTYPGHWDNSVAGHVEESDYLAGPDEHLDEVYRQVAERELLEELGVRAPIEELGHFPPEQAVHYEQLRLFRAHSDGPYHIQEEEVEEVRALTPDEYRALRDAGEPVTNALMYFVDWLHRRGLW